MNLSNVKLWNGCLMTHKQYKSLLKCIIVDKEAETNNRTPMKVKSVYNQILILENKVI